MASLKNNKTGAFVGAIAGAYLIGNVLAKKIGVKSKEGAIGILVVSLIVGANIGAAIQNSFTSSLPNKK